MKFDIIVGNPPYNNDIYLDFIRLSHNLSTRYTCMIVPAKWSAKNTDQNIKFRNEIVGYISDIIFYRNTHDIFDIAEPGGISIILLGKQEVNNKRVKSVCTSNKLLSSDGVELHTESNLILASNKIVALIQKINESGESIARYLNFSRCEFIGEQEQGNSTRTPTSLEVMQGDKVVGYIDIADIFKTADVDKYKCIQPCMSSQGSGDPFSKETGKALGSSLISIIKPNQIPKGSFQVLKTFETEQEAISFKSYINSLTMSFMQFMGICGATVTAEFFRFIPYENNWSQIYVDRPHSGVNINQIGTNGSYIYNGIKYCSLYKRYKLEESEIQLIEGTIRSRKHTR